LQDPAISNCFDLLAKVIERFDEEAAGAASVLSLN
jgi:hypothetical protein